MQLTCCVEISRPARLCGFPIVRSYNPAELSFTSNNSFEPGDEGAIEHFIFHSYSAMRSLRIVVVDPDSVDIVELVSTKTDEMIQALALEGATALKLPTVRNESWFNNPCNWARSNEIRGGAIQRVLSSNDDRIIIVRN